MKNIFIPFLGPCGALGFPGFEQFGFPGFSGKKNVSESFIRTFEGNTPLAKGVNFIVLNISELVIKIYFFSEGWGRRREGVGI